MAKYEAETSAELVKSVLGAAGQGVVASSRIRRKYPMTLGRIEGRGRSGKALMAACVLEYCNTMLAAVEAKAWDQTVTEGVGQSKDCAHEAGKSIDLCDQWPVYLWHRHGDRSRRRSAAVSHTG